MKNCLPLLAVFALISCHGNLDNMNPSVSGGTEDSPGHGMIVLGDRLANPFSVENMTKAMESLYPYTKSDRVLMTPTDKYIRILPRNSEEYDELVSMGLQMLDHPVDFEILREGDYYHDPLVPDGDITWQYAVVSRDFTLPSRFRSEVLEECFIPEDDILQTKSGEVDWLAVERRAYEMTGNGRLLRPVSKAGKAEGSRPQGRICIVDGRNGDDPEGVRGVMVQCNSFVKFAHAYTDQDGNYSIDRSFASDPRYRIVFKNRSGFEIGMNLLLSPASASTLGKNPSAGVDVVITQESDRKLFTRSAVNNAAYDYYAACKAESITISRPPGNLRIWLFQNLRWSSSVMMQQGVLVDGGRITDFLKEYAFLIKIFLPDITLGLKEMDDYSQVYSAALHELAHASHFMMAGKDFWARYVRNVLTSYITSGFVHFGIGTEEDSGYCEVAEMWAYYMQTSMYNDRYPDAPLTYGTNFWFYPQILMYLEERGMSRYKIFAALTPDINSREMLQKKLTSLYPEMKSTIKQAFNRYN